MKKLLLLLLIPLFSFSQLTLETMSSINDAQSFKRTMIENGFSVREDGSGVSDSVEYQKLVGGRIEMIAYYMMKTDEDNILFDERMMVAWIEDYKGENESYQAIYTKVKNDCEFVDVRDGVGGDIAYYKCPYENPSKELLELQELFEKEIPESPNINILNFEVGFNKSDSLFLIHFPVTDKANSGAVQMIKKFIESRNSGELDELMKELDSVN